jgi:hypothetical protein
MRSVVLCAILLQHGASLLHSKALTATKGNGLMDVVRWLLAHGADVMILSQRLH